MNTEIILFALLGVVVGMLVDVYDTAIEKGKNPLYAVLITLFFWPISLFILWD